MSNIDHWPAKCPKCGASFEIDREIFIGYVAITQTAIPQGKKAVFAALRNMKLMDEDETILRMCDEHMREVDEIRKLDKGSYTSRWGSNPHDSI